MFAGCPAWCGGIAARISWAIALGCEARTHDLTGRCGSPPKREERMVWAITIASFLGAAVVALLIFFIYSQKEQIRKALKERRGEGRIPVEVELELCTPHEPTLYEKSLAKNASRHGARIVSRKH